MLGLPQITVPIPRLAAVPAPEPADPIRSFAEWAIERADGVAWVRSTAAADDAFAALTHDVPELATSGVRWSGAGVLPAAGIEWFAFEGAAGSAIVFALSGDPATSTRQPGVIAALGAHRGLVVRGGRTPRRLAKHLRGLRGVPVWHLAGLGRLAPGALTEPGFPTLAA